MISTKDLEQINKRDNHTFEMSMRLAAISEANKLVMGDQNELIPLASKIWNFIQNGNTSLTNIDNDRAG